MWMGHIKAKYSENTRSFYPNRLLSIILSCNMHHCMRVCVKWRREISLIQQNSAVLHIPRAFSLASFHECKCFCVCVCAWACACQLNNTVATDFSTSLVHITPLCLITYIWFLLVHSAAVQSTLHWSPSGITTLCFIKVRCTAAF